MTAKVEPVGYHESVHAAICSMKLVCKKPGCLRCKWRLRTATSSLSPHDKELLKMCTAEGEEVALNVFSDGVADAQEIIDLAEKDEKGHRCYDEHKVRALFGLGAQPPRLQQCVAVAQLDMVSFMHKTSAMLAEHQIRGVTRHFRKVLEDRAREDKEAEREHDPSLGITELQSALGMTGLAGKITERNARRIIARIQRFTKATLHNSLPKIIADEEHARLSQKMRKETMELREWSGAVEHSVVRLEGFPVLKGEDKQWAFAVYEELDEAWPWEKEENVRNNIIAGDKPTQADDDKLFTSLFFGVTVNPVRIGPGVPGTSLSGIAMSDGKVTLMGKEEPETSGALGGTKLECKCDALFVKQFVKDQPTGEEDFGDFEHAGYKRRPIKAYTSEEEAGDGDDHSMSSGSSLLSPPCSSDLKEGDRVQFYSEASQHWQPAIVGHRFPDGDVKLLGFEGENRDPVILVEKADPSFCRRCKRVITFRLNRKLKGKDELSGFECDFWMKANGEEARQLMDDIEGLMPDDVVFPCVYAARPYSDVLRSTMVRGCSPSWTAAFAKWGFHAVTARSFGNRLKDECTKAVDQIGLYDEFIMLLGDAWHWDERCFYHKQLDEKVWALHFEVCLRQFQAESKIAGAEFMNGLKYLQKYVEEHGGKDGFYEQMRKTCSRNTHCECKPGNSNGICKQVFEKFTLGPCDSRIIGGDDYKEYWEAVFEFLDNQGLGHDSSDDCLTYTEFSLLGSLRPEVLQEKSSVIKRLNQVVKSIKTVRDNYDSIQDEIKANEAMQARIENAGANLKMRGKDERPNLQVNTSLPPLGTADRSGVS